MSRVEVEGNSIDEAIEKALGELGVPREQARVEILQDARKGLLGFGGQKARVIVSVRGAALEDAEPAAAAAAQGGAADVLRALLDRMGFAATVEVAGPDADGRMVLRIATEASGLLIGRHGQTLDALEYLVNRIHAKGEERGAHVVVDCEAYRERHERELRDTALRLAEKVRERGKPQTTMPMNPRDRRIVHLALAGDTRLVTRSIGQGYLRRVVISRAAKAAAPAEPSS